MAYGMSATFLFDMAMIVLFPILGRWLGLSDASSKVRRAKETEERRSSY